MDRIAKINLINNNNTFSPYICSQFDSVIDELISFNNSIISVHIQESLETTKRVSSKAIRCSSFIHFASTNCDEDSEQGSFTMSNRTKKEKKKKVVNDYSESSEPEATEEEANVAECQDE